MNGRWFGSLRSFRSRRLLLSIVLKGMMNLGDGVILRGTSSRGGGVLKEGLFFNPPLELAFRLTVGGVFSGDRSLLRLGVAGDGGFRPLSDLLLSETLSLETDSDRLGLNGSFLSCPSNNLLHSGIINRKVKHTYKEWGS